MKMNDFDILTEDRQFDLVRRYGTLLHRIKYPGVKTSLYDLERFFVEISYETETNRVIGIESFVDGLLLSRYSRMIQMEFKND